jgi:3D (Asp-Asp-Asp) domain-containing protein
MPDSCSSQASIGQPAPPRTPAPFWRGIALAALAGAALLFLTGSGPGSASREELRVTATAFNSTVAQTSAQPTLTAWGDRLRPGMKAIAVSRDLVRMGLRHGVEVEIEGLSGRYVVRDKMAKRWKKKIDIYMGRDVEAAREWGKRTVTIRWKAVP